MKFGGKNATKPVVYLSLRVNLPVFLVVRGERERERERRKKGGGDRQR